MNLRVRCPLCLKQECCPVSGIKESDPYFDCRNCGLVFLDPACVPDREREYAHYLTHENDPGDSRYRRFLSRLANPLIEKLVRGMEGLDYGSGPGPTLSLIFEEAGFPMSIYDPFFAPGTEVLERSYDFVTCSETVEHFHRPAEEFAHFERLLKKEGFLGVMTEILEPETSFAKWWYRRDPTHVCFYRRETMRWIAHSHGWSVTFPVRNVSIFQKRMREC
ncbi:MAG: class I SAM-dependent methyltransferase [Opitutales bacterium]